jgi:hypothetical protein
MYVRKTELTENSNFHLFAAITENRNGKLAANRNGTRKFVFLGWQTVNGNRRLLFQPTCSTMLNIHIKFNSQTVARLKKLFPKQHHTCYYCGSKRDKRYDSTESEFLNIYWRLKSRLFKESCLFKGHSVQQGSQWLQFILKTFLC